VFLTVLLESGLLRDHPPLFSTALSVPVAARRFPRSTGRVNSGPELRAPAAQIGAAV